MGHDPCPALASDRLAGHPGFAGLVGKLIDRADDFFWVGLVDLVERQESIVTLLGCAFQSVRRGAPVLQKPALFRIALNRQTDLEGECLAYLGPSVEMEAARRLAQRVEKRSSECRADCEGRDRVPAEQVRHIRMLAATQSTVSEILIQTGALNEAQVRRVLEGRTYGRIH